ncbi:MAG: hypothetical protein ACE5Q6_05390 [Dehalococcoidia bacterium]
MNPTKRPSWLLPAIIVFSLLTFVACGEEAVATPEPALSPDTSVLPVETIPTEPQSQPQIQFPMATSEPTIPTPTPVPQVATPVAKTPTPIIPLEATEPLTLQILSPQDGTGVEVAALKVMGSTSGGFVRINSLPAKVDPDGLFNHDFPIKQGVNLIDVVASDDFGQTKSQQLVVFSVEPTAGLPLTLLYPIDGIEVSEPQVDIVGVTALDAMVGVNEIPTEVSELGIFSTTAALEEGANLIEVVAADLAGNVRFQTVAVFYTP